MSGNRIKIHEKARQAVIVCGGARDFSAPQRGYLACGYKDERHVGDCSVRTGAERKFHQKGKNKRVKTNIY